MICTSVQKKLDNAFYSLEETTPLESIKLKDILEISRISKTTFYTNYDNIDDFIVEQIDRLFRPFDCDQNIYKSKPGSNTCVFVYVSEQLYKNKGFVKNIYESKYKKDLYDIIDYFFEERIAHCFSQNSCKKDNLEERTIFLASGYKGMIDKYIETGDENYLLSSAKILQNTIECYD